MGFAFQALAGLILCAWVAMTLDALLGRRHLPQLTAAPPPGPRAAVSIIVPARNEAAALPGSLPALLAQTYPDLEVIVLDDRSTDATPAILSALRSPRLTVVRIEAVPEGWLGKTHALDVGSRRARGEWLLFTDADVVFHPRAVEAAVALAEARGADHLVLTPHTQTAGFWEPILVGCFGLLFGLTLRPWRAADPESGAFVGIGAFNLIRREAYRRIGTHRALATEVVDDLELGRRVKQQGLRQVLARGEALLSLRWQVGLRGIVAGLEKNAFASLDYSIGKTLAACAGLALLLIVPLLALLAGGRGLWIPAAALPIALQAAHAAEAGLPLWSALFQPAGIAVLLYAILRSAVLVLARGGVVWRGTLYPVAALRRTGTAPR